MQNFLLASILSLLTMLGAGTSQVEETGHEKGGIEVELLLSCRQDELGKSSNFSQSEWLVSRTVGSNLSHCCGMPERHFLSQRSRLNGTGAFLLL